MYKQLIDTNDRDVYVHAGTALSTDLTSSCKGLLVEPAGAGKALTPDRGKHLVRNSDRVEEHERTSLRRDVAHSLASILAGLADLGQQGGGGGRLWRVD